MSRVPKADRTTDEDEQRNALSQLIADYNAAARRYVPGYTGGMSQNVAKALIFKGWRQKGERETDTEIFLHERLGRLPQLIADYNAAARLFVPNYTGGMSRDIAKDLVLLGWRLDG
jgi:hypothetical protein